MQQVKHYCNREGFRDKATKTTFNSFEMPIGAKVLTVQTQFNCICIWALVDKSETVKETRNFEVVGTGWDFENADKSVYIGTVQAASGNLIWHIFEITE